MKDHLDETPKDHGTSWNKREKKSPLLTYLLLAFVCLVLAYILSGAAK